MTRKTRWLAVLALVLLFAAFGAVVKYQYDIKQAQDEQAETTRKICVVQGITFAGILANLGLALQEARFLEKNANDPQIRTYYKAVAPALRLTLDGLFKRPPRCGEKFEFTIQIEGEPPRHVVTSGKSP